MFSQPILPKEIYRLLQQIKKTNLIISNNTSLSTELLEGTNVVYMLKCPLGDCISKENDAYVGLITTTLSRRLTMLLNDSSSIALQLKTHSIPKSKFRKHHCNSTRNK